MHLEIIYNWCSASIITIITQLLILSSLDFVWKWFCTCLVWDKLCGFLFFGFASLKKQVFSKKVYFPFQITSLVYYNRYQWTAPRYRYDQSIMYWIKNKLNVKWNVNKENKLYLYLAHAFWFSVYDVILYYIIYPDTEFQFLVQAFYQELFEPFHRGHSNPPSFCLSNYS